VTKENEELEGKDVDPRRGSSYECCSPMITELRKTFCSRSSQNSILISRKSIWSTSPFKQLLVIPIDLPSLAVTRNQVITLTWCISGKIGHAALCVTEICLFGNPVWLDCLDLLYILVGTSRRNTIPTCEYAGGALDELRGGARSCWLGLLSVAAECCKVQVILMGWNVLVVVGVWNCRFVGNIDGGASVSGAMRVV